MRTTRLLYSTWSPRQVYRAILYPRAFSVPTRDYSGSTEGGEYGQNPSNEGLGGQINGEIANTEECHGSSVAPSKKSRTTASHDKNRPEYYSLKDYREGPNTESGELDTEHDQRKVKEHNKDMENRFEKR